MSEARSDMNIVILSRSGRHSLLAIPEKVFLSSTRKTAPGAPDWLAARNVSKFEITSIVILFRVAKSCNREIS
jgi:hypothetical protein